MTVSSQTNNVTFVGNGVTTVFPLPFRFFSNSDVFAYFINPTTGASTPMVLGVDYTLQGAEEPEVDGNAVSVLTTAAPLANGRGMYVERIMAPIQSTDIVNHGEFFASTHEDVFDRLTMLIQQANANIKGAIRVAIGDPDPSRLPPAASRAMKLLGFDSLGNPIASTPAVDSATDLAFQLANNSDSFKGSSLVGYRGRTVHARLDDEINVKDYGAKGDNATDDYAAFAAAIAAAEAAGGGDVIVPGGTFLLSQTVTLPPYVALRGEGANRTILKSTSITGSVVHVTGSFCGVFDMTIGASDARKAGGSLGGFGIRQEAVDLPGRDTTCCTYQRLIVKDQPRHGIVLVASTMTALITQCIVRDNGGHGVWINNGEAVGRTNITRPGGIRIIDCKIQDNVGHSVKAGEGGSAIHGTAYRIFVDNCDTFRNATTSAIRSYNAGMHLFGEDIEVRNSALCGFAGTGGITPTTAGIWVGGRNIKLINNRYVNVVNEAVYVGNSADLSTQDVDIDGMLVTGDGSMVSLDPAVRVQSGAVGVRAVTHSTALITNLMTPTAVQYYSEFGNRIRSDIQRRQRQFSPSGVSSAIQNLSIADDQAAYINFSATAQGVLVISGSIAARGGAMVFFRVGATGHCTLMSSGGATVSVGTGALSTGAGDGVDGNLNIYADTATNRLYIKNRTGSAGNYGYTLLNVTQDVECDDLVRL